MPTVINASRCAVGRRKAARPEAPCWGEALEARTLMSTTPVTLRATGDAYVRDSAYGMTNFGTATDLQVQRSPYASETRETFLKFDLTGVTELSKVTLRLFGRLNVAGGAAATLVLDPVRDASWSETAITYNTRAD